MCRRRRGASTSSRASGITTASTISSPTSTRRTPRSGPRFSGSWATGSNSASRASAWMRCRSSSKATRRAESAICSTSYLTDFRDFLQWREGDAILLGEANVVPGEDASFFGNQGDRMHMMFNFYVNQHVFYALASGDAAPLGRALEATVKCPHFAQWASFLRNHDELDLGRLTEEQRNGSLWKIRPGQIHAAVSDEAFAAVWRRCSETGRSWRLAYSLMFSLPGTPVLRYGDEIGMGDDLELKERNSVRTPMQWCDESQAGFSTARRRCCRHQQRSLRLRARQRRRRSDAMSNSLLNWTERLIRLRKECRGDRLGYLQDPEHRRSRHPGDALRTGAITVS